MIGLEWIPLGQLSLRRQQSNKSMFWIFIYTVYKVKNEVLSMITGTEREEYGLLWNYCQEIYNKNSTSICVIKYRSDRKNDIFCRIYIWFAALKEGFLQCRHIIGIDGYHLSSTSKGVLLITVGIYLNNRMYLFAYAVIEKENNDTLELVHQFLGQGFKFLS